MKNIRQIKKVIILILFGIILISCTQEKELEFNTAQKQDNIVSEGLVKEIASNFLFNSDNTSPKTKIEDKKIVKEIFPVKDKEGETLFYIINYEKKGFLILSADKRISPILAYSANNEFRTNAKSYSPGLEDWLSIIKETIRTARIKQIEQTDEIKFEWDSFLHQTNPLDSNESNICDEVIELVGPLLLTEWAQGCHYNTYMPPLRCWDTCNSAPVGCVPLANYPLDYNWANMPNSRGSYTTAWFLRSIYDVINEDNGISRTTCEVTGVKGNYNESRVFTDFFNYSSAERSNYDKEIIKQDLRLNKPVLLSGITKIPSTGLIKKREGHMWVCDGLIRRTTCYFNSNGIQIISPFTTLSFHMNWGWGGYENGWYGYRSFDPSEYNFEYSIEMIHNIEP